MQDDALYMQRCLQLAEQGAGTAAPNPLVGAVIVRNGVIIAEGYHHHAGGPHAERVALAAVSDTTVLPTSTLYVNLEPCCHHGRTSPCANAIIEAGIKKVVIGTRDPFAKVNGGGIDYLRQYGCDVTVDVLPDACRWTNRRFFTFHEKQRPWVVLKWAQTPEGYIDAVRQVTNVSQAQSIPITGKSSRQLSHRWRTEEDAILVGTNTAWNDNPSLTARYWQGKNPVRLLIDRTLRIPNNYHLYNDAAKNSGVY